MKTYLQKIIHNFSHLVMKFVKELGNISKTLPNHIFKLSQGLVLPTHYFQAILLRRLIFPTNFVTAFMLKIFFSPIFNLPQSLSISRCASNVLNTDQLHCKCFCCKVSGLQSWFSPSCTLAVLLTALPRIQLKDVV